MKNSQNPSNLRTSIIVVSRRNRGEFEQPHAIWNFSTFITWCIPLFREEHSRRWASGQVRLAKRARYRKLTDDFRRRAPTPTRHDRTRAVAMIEGTSEETDLLIQAPTHSGI